MSLFDTHRALLQGGTQRAVQPVFEVEVALPLDAVGKEIAIERRVVGEQAAQVDGATPWQAFRKTVIPLAAPGVFTTAIIAFFIAWNDFVYGISLTSTSAARPVPAALAFFTGASQFTEPTGAISAAAMIVTIPVVIIVLLFQRRIVSGLTQGAVKG